MSRRALIVGASGLVGTYCLTELLDDPEYEVVTVLARRTFGREHPKRRLHVIDFDKPEEYRPLAVGDDVFCCLGTTIRTAGSQEAFRNVDFTYPVAVAEAALANGAAQFLIVTALGADPAARAFYNQVKGAVERAVTRMPFKTVHVFRPSLLVGNRSEFRLAERLAVSVLSPLSFVFAGPLRRYRPIEASAVASCMVKTAKRSSSGVHIHESESIQPCRAANPTVQELSR